MSQPVQFLKTSTESGEKHKPVDSWSNFLPAFVFSHDLIEGKVSYLNNRIDEYLGFSVGEVANLTKGLLDLAYPEDDGLVKTAIEKFYALAEGETYAFTARFRHKEGGFRFLKCTCSRYLPGAVLVVAQNVTEQIRSEEEASSTRQLFDETEKLLLFGTWSWDPLLDKMEWTEGMYDLLGYRQSEVPNLTTDFYLKHVLPEHVEHLQQVISEASSSRKDFEVEYVIKTKNGDAKFVYTKAKFLLEKDGNVKKVVGITRDITNKKNFEKERDRNIRELNRSNKELEEFAYVASHDLHEPLRKILTFTERLKGRATQALGDDGKTYLDRIWSSADNMRKLIDNLLEFSKISRGTRAFTHCNLNDVLRDVISDQELRIEETSTLVRIKDLPVVEGVPSELRQLFNNLIGNALKFRKKDVPPVISLTCRKISHKEKTDLLLPFNEVFFQINVQDNGIGFEAIYAEKIFEIFQRLHGKTEYSGSGIGLAICKKIVDNHDGLIYATGEPGVGSIFSVILPEKQYK